MTEKISGRVQFKRMTAAQWRASEVILLEGEIGFETDTGYAKFGDGVSRFEDLNYLTGPTGPKGSKGEQGPPGRDGVVTFESLTPQQREEIRGPQGEAGQDGQKGDTGLRGADGSTTTVSDSNPSGSVGKNGDIHINSTTGELFVKSANGWARQGSLKGVQGDPGQRGADGQSITTQVLTQTQYDTLNPKSDSTLYLITG